MIFESISGIVMRSRSKITKKRYSEYNAKYFKEREYVPEHILNAIDNVLHRKKGLHILEVGCGSGIVMRKLRKLGYIVDGIDISPVAVKLSGGKLASATKIPFGDKKFDCVVAISIIEHLYEKEGGKFINEARRVLKDNGIIFIVTPNFASPFRLLKGKQWIGYSDSTHVFFYTPFSLKKLLENNGFTHTKLLFKVTTPILEWPLPRFFQKFPNFLKLAINFFFATTPFAFISRDSFWIASQKTSDKIP